MAKAKSKGASQPDAANGPSESDARAGTVAEAPQPAAEYGRNTDGSTADACWSPREAPSRALAR